MESSFIKWEGEVYRIDDSGSGIVPFVKRDGKFVEADSRLTATIEFEGMPLDADSPEVKEASAATD